MTLAERVVYERLHGAGSAPAPEKHSPATLSELREEVAENARKIEEKRAAVESNLAAVEREERSAAALRAELERASAGSAVRESDPNVKNGNGTPSRDRVQRCVSPVFALKRFFADWSITGRSARSEIWWVELFVNYPLFILASIVGNSDLIIMIGIVALILLWPSACLEGRRFHDLGINAGVGIALVLAQVSLEILANVIPNGVGFLLVGRLMGLVLLLFNVAQSQQQTNQYGDIPNLSDRSLLPN